MPVAGILRVGLRFGHGEQLAGAGKVGPSGGAGEQAVVADAVEALRQDVEQEAANELVDRQGAFGGAHFCLTIGVLSLIRQKVPMTEERTTPLRERMIEDMRIRGMGDKA